MLQLGEAVPQLGIEGLSWLSRGSASVGRGSASVGRGSASVGNRSNNSVGMSRQCLSWESRASVG